MWRDCALATISPHSDWQRQQIATRIGEGISGSDRAEQMIRLDYARGSMNSPPVLPALATPQFHAASMPQVVSLIRM